MDFEGGSAKRPLEDEADTIGQELRLRQLERKWRVVTGRGVKGEQPPTVSRDRDKQSQESDER